MIIDLDLSNVEDYRDLRSIELLITELWGQTYKTLLVENLHKDRNMQTYSFCQFYKVAHMPGCVS